MKKGITPVISIVLLLLIVVAIIGIFFAWVVGIFNTATPDDPVGTLNLNKRAMIENVVCDPNTGTGVITLSIKASGSDDLVADTVSIYLDGSLQTAISSPAIASTDTEEVDVPVLDNCAAPHDIKIVDPAGIQTTETVPATTATCAADDLCKASGCVSGDVDCTCAQQDGAECAVGDTCDSPAIELVYSGTGTCCSDACTAGGP